MRKIIFALVALCAIPLSVNAKAIDEARAREVATRFFFGNFATKADYQNLTLVWDGSDLTSGTKSSSSDGFEFVTPSFYTYNRYGGGYVLISGDDSVEPVIGYSLDGEFNPDDMPPALAWWLEGVKKTIDRKRTVDAVASYDVQLAWKCAGTRASGTNSYYTGVGGKQLDTPQWNQRTPFNDHVPANCPCGCVATALAELMRYYSWPGEPEDLKIPEYTDKYGNVIGLRDLSDRKYIWANMPLTIDGCKKADSAVRNNIADLVADIGASVEMYYRADPNGGAGASTEKIVYSMGTYFKYNKAAHLEYRGSHSGTEWVDMMVRSIDEGHPLLTAGTSSEGGGHQFIVDGYDENHLMRFNFGWGTYYNGYWAVGVNEYAIGFSAIFDMYPDSTATSKFTDSVLSIKFFQNSDKIGIKPDTNAVLKAGTQYSYQFGWIYNEGPGIFSGYVRLGYLNKERSSITNMSNTASYSSLKQGSAFGYSSFSSTIPSGTIINLGDCVVLLYSTDKNDWTIADAVVDGSVISEYPAVPYAFIDLPKTCSPGSTFDLTLKNAPYRWYNSATWYILEPGSSSETAAGYANDSLESIDGHSFTFSKTGIYKVRVVVKDPGTNNIIDNISASIRVE